MPPVSTELREHNHDDEVGYFRTFVLHLLKVPGKMEFPPSGSSGLIALKGRSLSAILWTTTRGRLGCFQIRVLGKVLRFPTGLELHHLYQQTLNFFCTFTHLASLTHSHTNTHPHTQIRMVRDQQWPVRTLPGGVWLLKLSSVPGAH